MSHGPLALLRRVPIFVFGRGRFAHCRFFRLAPLDPLHIMKDKRETYRDA